jgi:virginiamycin A acetyltransferase
MTIRAKILFLTVWYFLASFYASARLRLRAAYKKSYHKIRYSAYVNSGDVSVSATLGFKTWIDPSVVIFGGVIIGDYTSVNKNTLIESGTIGKFCSIAANVSIGMAEHPMQHLCTHVATYDEPFFGLITSGKHTPHRKSEPVLGNDVWIARGATVLRGVTIGDGAVVAADSVVTKDVPPYAVVAGNPARVVRYRFEESIIESLASMRWWDDPAFYEREFERHDVGVEHFVRER